MGREEREPLHVVPAEDVVSCYDTIFIGMAVNAVVGGDASESVSVKGVKQPTVFETVEKRANHFRGRAGQNVAYPFW